MTQTEEKRPNGTDESAGESSTAESTPQQISVVDPAYGRLTKREKWFIVCLTAFVGLFR